MYAREATLTMIHRSMPISKGRKPTALRVDAESEAPIKNMVRVRHLRARDEIALPTAGIASST
jgi:hypothetical protein